VPQQKKKKKKKKKKKNAGQVRPSQGDVCVDQHLRSHQEEAKRLLGVQLAHQEESLQVS
jgi:hypothetical protein